MGMLSRTTWEKSGATHFPPSYQTMGRFDTGCVNSTQSCLCISHGYKIKNKSGNNFNLLESLSLRTMAWNMQR